ncbi:MAG: flagellar protein FlaG [Desulfitobacteriaceae bacterium]|nr:flagellar protein FlaG [Desulfitobacteriaceae bacterium]MDI6879462.1 flagellar protein FlaG [Desulfitobacteriaceae bacterium]MDI6912945.1 flagellar protein FlaG [Desulfitobacteriaceae bacterium]
MIQPPSSTSLSPMLPGDVFPGQKLESRRETPRPVVERKQEVPLAKEDIPRQEVEKTAEKLNRLMGLIDRRLEFSVHEKSQRVMVKVVNQETGEILDEIPPKKLLDLIASFHQTVGLFLDKKV